MASQTTYKEEGELPWVEATPGLCDIDTLFVFVQSNNLAPVANADHTSIFAGEDALINLLTNDYDPENDALTVTQISGGVLGTFTHRRQVDEEGNNIAL